VRRRRADAPRLLFPAVTMPDAPAVARGQRRRRLGLQVERRGFCGEAVGDLSRESAGERERRERERERERERTVPCAVGGFTPLWADFRLGLDAL